MAFRPGTAHSPIERDGVQLRQYWMTLPLYVRPITELVWGMYGHVLVGPIHLQDRNSVTAVSVDALRAKKDRSSTVPMLSTKGIAMFSFIVNSRRWLEKEIWCVFFHLKHLYWHHFIIPNALSEGQVWDKLPPSLQLIGYVPIKMMRCHYRTSYILTTGRALLNREHLI